MTINGVNLWWLCLDQRGFFGGGPSPAPAPAPAPPPTEDDPSVQRARAANALRARRRLGHASMFLTQRNTGGDVQGGLGGGGGTQNLGG